MIEYHMPTCKEQQILALLNFDFSQTFHTLEVSHTDIYIYVKENGLPLHSEKSADFGYEKIDDKWHVKHYERGIEIGYDIVETEGKVLDIILGVTFHSFSRLCIKKRKGFIGAWENRLNS